MKIVFVLTQSLDSPSGLGRYGPLAHEMAKLGYQVTVIALHYAWRQLSQQTIDKNGLKIYYVGQMHIRKEGPRKLYFNPIQLLAISLASTYRLAKVLYYSDADIIQLCKPQPINVLAARLSKGSRPIFCDCDDYEAETNRFASKWQKWLVRYFEDSIIRDVTGLTVNTRFSQQRYIRLGFPEDRIVYVPNGVDRARFCQPVEVEDLRKKLNLEINTPVVSYIGTLGLLSHPVDLLLNAFRQVLQHMPSAKLLLVGGGEDYDLLQQMVRQLGIVKQTIFAGRVPPHKVPAYLSLANVTVDPVHNNMIAQARSPLKVLESLVMGIPVVTGDVGDRRTLLAEGKFGLLVPPGDSDALAKGLLELLGAPELRMRMSQASLAERDSWYWENLVHKFVQVYQF
jgi:glycosyltransferase involved in cell wall biosynthesis